MAYIGHPTARDAYTSAMTFREDTQQRVLPVVVTKKARDF